VPILCPYCKQQVLILSKEYNKSLQLLNMYRIVTFNKAKRRQVLPIFYMPPDNKKEPKCKECVNGYITNQTIYEYLYITPESTLESLKKNHTYSTEEILISLILEGINQLLIF
jgi:hypothetical protein